IDKGLEIKPFNEAHAAQAAARLAANFPGTADWHAAKRKRCVQCLGFREQDVRVQASGKRCGATVDWVIAAHAAEEGWILVTDDTGPDFAGLELKMELGRVEQFLGELAAKRRDAGGVS